MFTELDYAGWPEPWWTVAFTVTEDFWDTIMAMNHTLGRDLSDTT